MKLIIETGVLQQKNEMGYGNEYPNASAPSAPTMSPDSCLTDELQAMGLTEWESSLRGCGLISLDALKLVDCNEDLPSELPNLVKKQIVKRAGELRTSTASTSILSPPKTDSFMINMRVITEDRTIEINVNGGSKLSEVKGKFPTNIPQPNKVMFEGNCIEEHMTLTDANVVAGSLLFIVPTKYEPANIYIKSRSGSVLTTSIHLHEQVCKLRSVVAELKQCKPQEVRLTFNELPLDSDFVILGQLHITDGSVIYIEN